ncbi:MAG: HAD-IIA family hydrolase [Anaerolineales bacterium]
MLSNHYPDIKALIIDMDGVLWHDAEPLGDLPRIFEKIRADGYRFILATNNATRTIEEYYEKLASFGVNVLDGEVITTAFALGIYLKQQYSPGISTYVIGKNSLKQTLKTFGVEIVDENTDHPDVVVASLDYSLTYNKLKHASLSIQSGSDFIGTNPDVTLPTPEGFIPGSGTVIGALEIASGKKARIIGKPEPLLYEMALRYLGVRPAETLAIGDRLETDILGAQRAGIHTALVLTGASTREDARQFQPRPEIIAGSLTELIF